MNKIILIFILVFSTLTAQAQNKARKLVSIGFMALNSSTTQGGAGPTGSSILTQSEFVWAYPKFGVGLVFDYDLHGTNEKDSAYGLKVEGYYRSFFVELGYLMSAKRAYTDRAIAEETGSGMIFGLGARFQLKGGSNGPFFHASYKLKTQTLNKQDGIDLSEPIKQQDGYPIFGFGFSF